MNDNNYVNVISNNRIQILCDDCLAARPNDSTMDSIKSICDTLKEVSQNLLAVTDRMSKCEQRISDLESRGPSNGNFADVIKAVEEHAKRQEKKNNVVIHFLPDADNFNANQDMNGGGLIGNDMEKVAKLVEATNGDPASIVKVFRMGGARDDGKSRPLKVICNDSWTKRGLITGQKRLQQKFPILAESKMFVRDDLTDLQREEDKKLREQLKIARDENPGKDLVIRNFTICEKAGKRVTPFL